MTIYLLLASIGVFAFWVYYKLALKYNTHFDAIRVYFIMALLICLLLPLVDEIEIENTTSQSFVQLEKEESIDLLILNQVTELKREMTVITGHKKESIQWIHFIYVCGCAFFLVRMLHSLFAIFRIKTSSERISQNGIQIYFNDNIRQPFSLFKSIYLPKIWKGSVPTEVIYHERVHIDQWHFIDLLLAELLTIVVWFNPFAYLIKKDLRANLEFLADEAVINKGCDVGHYQSLLLSVATNSELQVPLKLYFNVPLKNRITMMAKKKTNSISKMTLLGILPIAGLLVALNTSKELKAPLDKLVAPISVIAEENKPSIPPIERGIGFKVTAHYGMKMHPVLKVEKMHMGIDLRAKLGTPVYATAEGTVDYATFDSEYGNFVQIKHSETFGSKYSHLEYFVVMPNEFVIKGQVIGYVGNTGMSTAPHLHYEVLVNGSPVDPKDFFELDDC